jgi:hypothetical protein
MKKITFYTSFEAHKQSELEETLKLSPIERIALVVERIRKIYDSKKELPTSTKRIHFISVGN